MSEEITIEKSAGRSARILVRDLYSVGEEIANALTHGIGALLGVVALTLMIVMSARYSDAARLISALIYGSSLVLLYLTSTLYHSIQSPRAKKLFQILDHCAIYILIAGTYTPFMLISLKGTWGYSLLVAIWSLAIFGIVFKAIFHDRYAKVSLFTYLAMGWLCVLVGGEMLTKIPAGGLWFLLAGGLAYTFGTIFFAMERLPYNHAIWHLFVLAGSVFHFFAIYQYVLPSEVAV